MRKIIKIGILLYFFVINNLFSQELKFSEIFNSSYPVVFINMFDKENQFQNININQFTDRKNIYYISGSRVTIDSALMQNGIYRIILLRIRNDGVNVNRLEFRLQTLDGGNLITYCKYNDFFENEDVEYKFDGKIVSIGYVSLFFNIYQSLFYDKNIIK